MSGHTWKENNDWMPSSNDTLQLQILEPFQPNLDELALLTWLRATIAGSWISRFLYALYFYVIIYPFSRLYVFGPSRWGLGFWNGRDKADMCAHLSGASGPGALHFVNNPHECVSMIQRDFTSALILFEMMLLYPICLYAAYRLGAWLLKSCCGCACSCCRRKRRSEQDSVEEPSESVNHE
jgi:hypothetical protein